MDDVLIKNTMKAIVGVVWVRVAAAAIAAVAAAVVIVVEAEIEVGVHEEVATARNETLDEVTGRKPLGSLTRVRELSYLVWPVMSVEQGSGGVVFHLLTSKICGREVISRNWFHEENGLGLLYFKTLIAKNCFTRRII